MEGRAVEFAVRQRRGNHMRQWRILNYDADNPSYCR